MGAGNIISGFFGGMGGNAMIGLSTIACLNGGRGRLAPVSDRPLLCMSVHGDVAVAGSSFSCPKKFFNFLTLPY